MQRNGCCSHQEMMGRLVLHTWGWLHSEFIGRLRIEESFKLGVDAGVVVESKRHLSWEAHHGSSMFRSTQEYGKNKDSCTNPVRWQTLLILCFSVQLLGLSNFLQSKLAGRFVQGRLDGNHIVHLPGPKIQKAHRRGELSLDPCKRVNAVFTPINLSKELHINENEVGCKFSPFRRKAWKYQPAECQPINHP